MLLTELAAQDEKTYCLNMHVAIAASESWVDRFAVGAAHALDRFDVLWAVILYILL